jgi:hypothetical protein
LITKVEAEKAMRQPVREPISNQFLSISEKDRKENQGLIDQGVVWMRTCDYNGTQEGMLDFLSLHLYKFVDAEKAALFYKNESTPSLRKTGRCT